MAFDIMQEPTSRRTGGRLTPDATILDLLNHPAFAGFGRLLLPWDDRTYHTSMQLRDVSALLPYHSRVDPATVVSALNHMIDDVNNGHTVFYDFYAENEKREQPTKSNTGLFFFRGKPGAPFAVIAPGGGFSYVGSVHEGFPYAVAIASHGYNAFVLKYRAGAGGAVATQDLAAAISYVFRHAKKPWRWHRRLFLVGQFGWRSNGRRHRLARGGAIRGNDLPKPSAVVMAYTGHSEFSTHEPSTFVVVGERDGIVPPSVMERRVHALRKLGAEVEFHRYRHVGHGFGPGIGTTAEGWLDRAVRFWEKAIRSNERRLR